MILFSFQDFIHVTHDETYTYLEIGISYYFSFQIIKFFDNLNYPLIFYFKQILDRQLDIFT